MLIFIGNNHSSTAVVIIKCSEGEINKIGIKMDEQFECVVK